MGTKIERAAADKRILDYLSRFGEHSTNEVAEATGIIRASISEKLNRLKKLGQVQSRLQSSGNVLLWKVSK